MKTQKGFREQNSTNELRKAKRLEPMVKSGKERYHLYRDIDNGDDDDELIPTPKGESILDYYDDGDDIDNDDDNDDDDYDDDDYDYDGNDDDDYDGNDDK